MTDHRLTTEQALKEITAALDTLAATITEALDNLATVGAPDHAPAPTPAEELLYRADLLDNGDPDGDTPHALRTIAARAEQLQHDRDAAREALTLEGRRVEKIAHDRAEARARVERLTTERDAYERMYLESRAEATALAEDLAGAESEAERLTAERLDRNPENKARVKAALNNLDQVEKVAVQKGAESPNPADVKPGEAWMVECRGERRNAVKDNDDNNVPWNTVNADGWCLPEDNWDVTLIARLVPAPRIITNPDELEALPHRTVIRDNAGVMFQRIVHGWYQAGDTSVHRSDDNFVCLPATVLWEPEA